MCSCRPAATSSPTRTPPGPRSWRRRSNGGAGAWTFAALAAPFPTATLPYALGRRLAGRRRARCAAAYCGAAEVAAIPARIDGVKLRRACAPSVLLSASRPGRF